MDYEYAVEPHAVAASLDRFQNVISRFGFEKGRLISDFPQKNWCRLVRLAIEENRLEKGERKRVFEELAEVKKKGRVFRFPGRSNEDRGDWLQNAIAENERDAFTKIILRESSLELPNLIFVEKMADADFKTESHVKRNIDDLLSVSHMLLRFSSRIDIIDPYIRIDRLSKDQNTRTLLNKFLTVVKKRSGPHKFRIHFRESRVPMEHIRGNLCGNNSRRIFNFLPDGMNIEMFCWRKREDSNLPFHDRYLLGNKGGISLGAGFEPKVGETTILGRHDLDDVKEIRQWFAFDNTGHEWIEPGFRIFLGRRPEEIWRGDADSG